MSDQKDNGLASNFGASVFLALELLALAFAFPVYAFRGDGGSPAYSDVPVKNETAALERSNRQAQEISQARKKGVEVIWSSDRIAPSVVRGSDLGGKQALLGGKGLHIRKGAEISENALAVMDDLSALYGMKDAAAELALKKIEADAKGFQHVRLNQLYQGLRVVGSELIVHFDPNGLACEVNGQYVPDIGVDPSAKQQAEDAVRIAREDLVSMGLPKGELLKGVELVIYARNRAPRLAYEFALTYGAGVPTPGCWRYWIDAMDGKILMRYNDIQRIAAPSVNGSPSSISGKILDGEGGSVTNVIGWHENSGAYYLSNATYSWCIYNVALSGYLDSNTYANRSSSDWGSSDTTEMSAARNFDLVQRYYHDVHGRNSMDDAHRVALVNVHYGDQYVNAFWSPSTLDFSIGDGDGLEANSLAVLDVLSHEYTHGVTQYSCNLTYAYESGALNESFSDVMGACVEFHWQPDDRTSYPHKHSGEADWLMGEDCWLTSIALRDMRNPANSETVGYGGEQPSYYKGTYWASGSADNGGVHQNSGVQNFFFYLLCEGGSGTNNGHVYSLTGIGITNAEQVAYQTLTHYCTADTDYKTVVDAWVSAAKSLNTNWVKRVRLAWHAVGCLDFTTPTFAMPSLLPSGRVGTPYSATLGPVGGFPPYKWTWVSGTLPQNLTFNDGVISGLPEQAGTSTFTVTLTDDMDQKATRTFTLTVNPVFSVPFVETFENGGALPDGWAQTNVEGMLNWTFMSGSPQGHPASAHGGTYNACFALSDTNQPVTRLISPRIDFGEGTRFGQLTFWQYMESWGGDTDELRVYYKTTWNAEWTLLATFKNAVAMWTQRTLSLPTPSRTYYFAFEGMANYGYGACVDDVQVIDPYTPLKITTGATLPNATAEASYATTLTATGGVGTAYSFAITSGSLPSGLTLSTNGVISGTTAVVSTNTFTVQVTDSDVPPTQVSKTFTLVVETRRATLFAEDFEHGGQMAAGWTQEYVTNETSWAVATSGKLGHPTGAASGNFFALLWSGDWLSGESFDHKTRLVSPVIDLSQAPPTLRLSFWHCMERWTSGQDELRVYYKTSMMGAWTLMPGGVFTNNVSTWTLQTISLPNPSGTYYIAFEGNARFGYGVCLDDIRITDEAAAPLITTFATLANGMINTSYSQTLAAVGGSVPYEYTWTVVSNALPSGLTLSTGGVISGTPTVGGTFYVGVQAMGSDGRTNVKVFKLRILDAFPIPYTETFENSGALPAGWTIDNSASIRGVSWTFRRGSLGGVPTAPHGGSYNANLFAENAYNNVSTLISPMLDLGTNTPNTKLTFWHCMANYGGDQDELRVYYRTSTNDVWNLIETYTDNVPGWTQQTVDLPNPSSTYFIAFEGNAKWGYGVCIDDVSVTGDVSTASSPYDSWKLAHFSSGEIEAGLITGDSDDPDGDGVPNLLEYAMGLDPRVPDTAGLPTGGIMDRHLYLTYRESKQATDVLFEVEACTSLILKDWTTLGVSEVLRSDSNTWWQVTAWHDILVTNAPTRFLRLKVTKP